METKVVQKDLDSDQNVFNVLLDHFVVFLKDNKIHFRDI